MAGILGALGGLSGLLGKKTPFDKAVDGGFDLLNKGIDRETALGIGDQQIKGKKDIAKLIGDQNLKITDKNIGGQLQLLKEALGNQDKWTQAGLDSYKEAGLPGFSFFDRNRGNLNVGSTSSYVGGNNFVRSFGGPGTKLPTTGTSPFADMNGLSRPF